MGNGYKQHFSHKPTFLPILILCSKWEHFSPKMGCMGHVKRSNRIVVSHKFNTTTNNNGIKYFKLKKLFSGMNLTGTRTSCTRKQVLVNRTGRTKKGDGKENSGSINIENMDLPLPVNVMKRAPKQGDKGKSKMDALSAFHMFLHPFSMIIISFVLFNKIPLAICRMMTVCNYSNSPITHDYLIHGIIKDIDC
ncbi:hypothetical protein HRI_000154500 [Hibiscus trionum]|uniref:Uncharacterized protein n=1 Tax=Hibiscus trionum TaxID=183268 RepID=A0A9W7GSI1_HIBTR|nr:hypothetical protein HRI_000154500 [Hibiscus trionum]